MKRIALLAGSAVLAAGCSGSHGKTLGGPGVTLSLPHGWYGVSAPGQLQAADFPLSRRVLASAERAHVRRGHVHLVLWDYGPQVPGLAGDHPNLRGPLVLLRVGRPFEGFPQGHAYAERTATINGEVLQALADLGPKSGAAMRLRDVNRVLRTLHVPSPRVLRPHLGVLSADRLSLRLLPGWSGRIEIPPAKFATRLVLRARTGQTRLTLLELPRSLRGQQRSLPVTLRRFSAHFARRVFSIRGRSFDISAVFASRSGLEQANRLLTGLKLR
jgi:hypothetical protein